MYPIQRQADVYAAFEPQNRPERTAAAIPESEVADLLRGPSIMAGLNVRHKEAETNWDDVWRNTVQPWPDMPQHQREQVMNDAVAQGVSRPRWHQERDRAIGQTASLHEAVDTHGMDPDSHAYATELPYGPGGEWQGDETGGPAPRREYNPYSGYEPTGEDELRQEAVHEDDESGYNWGPEPRPEDAAGPGMDPNFSGGAPLPFGTPTYNPGGGYDDHP